MKTEFVVYRDRWGTGVEGGVLRNYYSGKQWLFRDEPNCPDHRSDLCFFAAGVNDSLGLERKDIETKLAELFAKEGITLRFEDVTPPGAKLE